MTTPDNRLREKAGQPILNACRRILAATDDAERSAALGDLYNAMRDNRRPVLTALSDADFATDESGHPYARYDDGTWQRIDNPGRYVQDLLRQTR